MSWSEFRPATIQLLLVRRGKASDALTSHAGEGAVDTYEGSQRSYPVQRGCNHRHVMIRARRLRLRGEDLTREDQKKCSRRTSAVPRGIACDATGCAAGTT